MTEPGSAGGFFLKSLKFSFSFPLSRVLAGEAWAITTLD